MTVTIQITDVFNLSLPFFGRLGREGGGRSSPFRALRSATGVVVVVVPILAPALETFIIMHKTTTPVMILLQPFASREI
jgi:hypothetical protein